MPDRFVVSRGDNLEGIYNSFGEAVSYCTSSTKDLFEIHLAIRMKDSFRNFPEEKYPKILWPKIRAVPEHNS